MVVNAWPAEGLRCSERVATRPEHRERHSKRALRVIELFARLVLRGLACGAFHLRSARGLAFDDLRVRVRRSGEHGGRSGRENERGQEVAFRHVTILSNWLAPSRSAGGWWQPRVSVRCHA